MEIQGNIKPVWDIFICHASEDKDNIVRPLVKNLVRQGFKVWFDEFNLSVGKSLRREIDRGLSLSRHAVVILSLDFLKKEWPQKELDALYNRERDKIGVILPVWHNISIDDLKEHCPTLADRFATSTVYGINRITADIIKAINPDNQTNIDIQESEQSQELFGVVTKNRALFSTNTIEDNKDGIIKKPPSLRENSLRSESTPVFSYGDSHSGTIKLDTIESKIYQMAEPILPPSCGAFIVSPNKRRLACIAAENNKLFLTVNGNKSEAFDRFENHTLCFSPDSVHVACGIILDDNGYLLFDNDRLNFNGRLTRLAFSPNSREYSFSLCRNNKWIVVQNGIEGKEYDGLSNTGLVYSPDSRHLLYVGKLSDTARLVLDGIEIARHENIGNLAFSPDGCQIAYVAVDKDRYKIILDGTEIEEISPDEDGSLIFDERTKKPKLVNVENEGSWLVTLSDESLGRFAVKPTLCGINGITSDNFHIGHTFVSIPGNSALSPKKDRSASAIPIGYRTVAMVVGDVLGPIHDGICPPVFSPDGEHVAYIGENGGDWSLFVDGVPISTYYDGFILGGDPCFERENLLTAIAHKKQDVFVVEVYIS